MREKTRRMKHAFSHFSAMTDFDEQFRKQFEATNEKKSDNDLKIVVPEKEETGDKEATNPKHEEERKDEIRQKRIRKNFFTGLRGKFRRENKGNESGIFANLLIGFANILIIIGIVVLVRTFIISPFSVVGSSMNSNLMNSDLILVDKLTYRFSEPKRGDVIVFHPPIEKISEQKGFLCRAKKAGYVLLRRDTSQACRSRDHFVKRIIGIPGDTVEIRNRKVYVTSPDGKRVEINESFLDTKNQRSTCFISNCNSSRDTNGVFVEVPENTLYVLGDNRTGSSDSRVWNIEGKYTPFVKYDDVSGKVRMIFFPLSHISILPKIDPMITQE